MTDLLVCRIFFSFATLQQKRGNVADPILPLSLIRSVYEMSRVYGLVACFTCNLYFAL